MVSTVLPLAPFSIHADMCLSKFVAMDDAERPQPKVDSNLFTTEKEQDVLTISLSMFSLLCFRSLSNDRVTSDDWQNRSVQRFFPFNTQRNNQNHTKYNTEGHPKVKRIINKIRNVQKRKSSAAAIEKSGRRRMLSQRIEYTSP